MYCIEVKKSTYPPRNVRKSKKGSHNNNCTALKLKRIHISSQKRSQIQKKVRTTVALHWSQKEYLSSQKRSQIQKRFAQQLHCTYPPRNVRKSKKGSHNSCTALKSKRVPILPETFANPKRVRTTVALHWSQKVYLSSQKRSQIQKRFAHWQLHYPPRNVRKSKKGSHNNCTSLKLKRVPILQENFANPKRFAQQVYVSTAPRNIRKSLHDNNTVLIMVWL